jgi:hypothetical protein
MYVLTNAAADLPEEDRAQKEDLYKKASEHFHEIENKLELIDFIRWAITNDAVSDNNQMLGIIDQCKDQILEGKYTVIDIETGNDRVEKTSYLIQLASLFTPESFPENSSIEGDIEKRDELLRLARDNIQTVNDYISLIVAFGAKYESLHLGLKEKAEEIVDLAKKNLNASDFKTVQKEYNERVLS